MKHKVIGYIKYSAVAVVCVFMTACAKVFPNGDLDNFWRLNTIEYTAGTDFEGNPCNIDTCIGRAYYSFAMDLVEIDYHDISSYYSMIGAMTRMQDSILIDFSVYNDEHQSGFVPDGGDHSIHTPADILKYVRMCGMETLKEKFAIDKLDSQSMILSNSKVILTFEKW